MSRYIPHPIPPILGTVVPVDVARSVLEANSIHDSARILGVSYGLAWRWSRDFGIQRRMGPRGPRCPIPAGIDLSRPVKELAHAYLVSENTVRRWRARAK